MNSALCHFRPLPLRSNAPFPGILVPLAELLMPRNALIARYLTSPPPVLVSPPSGPSPPSSLAAYE